MVACIPSKLVHPIALVIALPMVHVGTYQLIPFAVCTDADLEKTVLTCTQVALSMWKVKYLSDTELVRPNQ